MSNSVRHSATSAVDVTVTAHSEKVRIEVSDEGQGFLSHATGGEGLGLALVDEIATSWGVVVEGRFTVWVEIPRTPSG